MATKNQIASTIWIMKRIPIPWAKFYKQICLENFWQYRVGIRCKSPETIENTGFLACHFAWRYWNDTNGIGLIQSGIIAKDKRTALLNDKFSRAVLLVLIFICASPRNGWNRHSDQKYQASWSSKQSIGHGWSRHMLAAADAEAIPAKNLPQAPRQSTSPQVDRQASFSRPHTGRPARSLFLCPRGTAPAGTGGYISTLIWPCRKQRTIALWASTGCCGKPIWSGTGPWCTTACCWLENWIHISRKLTLWPRSR